MTTTSPRGVQVLGLLGWLLLCFAAAAVGGIASANAAGFYTQLDRPGFAPPGWVFGPVWTVLYAMQAVAAWLVWRDRAARGRRTALGVFLVQLAVNAVWSWLFFAWRMGAAAFIDVAALLVLVVVTALLFWRVRPAAGALLVPYAMWVAFATALTWAIWRANPSLLG